MRFRPPRLPCVFVALAVGAATAWEAFRYECLSHDGCVRCTAEIREEWGLALTAGPRFLLHWTVRVLSGASA